MGGQSDYIGDLFIGRISVDTDIQLATIIAKIKLEERIPNPDMSWYSHILLAGDPSSSGYSCIDLNIYIKEMMKRYYPGLRSIRYGPIVEQVLITQQSIQDVLGLIIEDTGV